MTPQEKYQKANTFILPIRFVKTTEQDIIEWLDEKENKSGYIKSLIRADIEKAKK